MCQHSSVCPQPSSVERCNAEGNVITRVLTFQHSSFALLKMNRHMITRVFGFDNSSVEVFVYLRLLSLELFTVTLECRDPKI